MTESIWDEIKDINWRLKFIKDNYEARKNPKLIYKLREFALQVVNITEKLLDDSVKTMLKNESNPEWEEIIVPCPNKENIKRICVFFNDERMSRAEFASNRRRYTNEIFPSNTFRDLNEKKMYISLLEDSAVESAFKVYNYAKKTLLIEFDNDRNLMKDIDAQFLKEFEANIKYPFEDAVEMDYSIERVLKFYERGITTDILEDGCKIILPESNKKSEMKNLYNLWEETKHYNQLLFLYLSYCSVNEKLLRQITIDCFRHYIDGLAMHKDTFERYVNITQDFVEGKITKEEMFSEADLTPRLFMGVSFHTCCMHNACQFIRYDDIKKATLGALNQLFFAAGMDNKKFLKFNSKVVEIIRGYLGNPFGAEGVANVDVDLLKFLFDEETFAMAQYGRMYLEVANKNSFNRCIQRKINE